MTKPLAKKKWYRLRPKGQSSPISGHYFQALLPQNVWSKIILNFATNNNILKMISAEIPVSDKKVDACEKMLLL